MANANKKHIKSLEKMAKHTTRLAAQVEKTVEKLKNAQGDIGVALVAGRFMSEEERAVMDKEVARRQKALNKRITKFQKKVQKAHDDLHLAISAMHPNITKMIGQ